MSVLVSVIIPTYDRLDATRRAVASVVSARPDVIEIIVVDDGGTIPYSHPTPRNSSGIPVQVVRLGMNAGPGMARKAGVELAAGRYIAFLDSDDSYDRAWIDWAVSQLETDSRLRDGRSMLSGAVNGARPIGAAVRQALACLPGPLQLHAARFVAILFNPFYIQSLLLDRNLCAFLDGVRYCEDYFVTAQALFQADVIVLPRLVACHLGRAPNTAGGLSSASAAMGEGEMQVRNALMHHPAVPYGYKLLIPFGMIYQTVRIAAKKLLARFKR